MHSAAGAYWSNDKDGMWSFKYEAADKMGLKPEECSLVAAHLDDLKAAKACGFSTIYVERAREERHPAMKDEGIDDVRITEGEEGFVEVARRLGIQVAAENSLSGNACPPTSSPSWIDTYGCIVNLMPFLRPKAAYVTLNCNWKFCCMQPAISDHRQPNLRYL